MLSGLFEIIGPEGTTFKVHEDLLAKRSKALDKAVRGAMRESKTKSLEIVAVEDDLDDDTVMRFLEYIYTNDYPVPELAVCQSPPATERAVDILADGDDSLPDLSWVRELRMPTNSATATKGMANKKDKSPPVSKICYVPSAVASPVLNPDDEGCPCFDTTSIFLCHARLYKFADRYECPDLMELSLAKLRQSLAQYAKHQKRVRHLVELIRYTYLHTMDFEEGRDRMRSVVLSYAYKFLKELSSERSFLDLLKGPGCLASDLVTKLVELRLGGQP